MADFFSVEPLESTVLDNLPAIRGTQEFGAPNLRQPGSVPTATSPVGGDASQLLGVLSEMNAETRRERAPQLAQIDRLIQSAIGELRNPTQISENALPPPSVSEMIFNPNYQQERETTLARMNNSRTKVTLSQISSLLQERRLLNQPTKSKEAVISFYEDAARAAMERQVRKDVLPLVLRTTKLSAVEQANFVEGGTDLVDQGLALDKINAAQANDAASFGDSYGQEAALATFGPKGVRPNQQLLTIAAASATEAERIRVAEAAAKAAGEPAPDWFPGRYKTPKDAMVELRATMDDIAETSEVGTEFDSKTVSTGGFLGSSTSFANRRDIVNEDLRARAAVSLGLTAINPLTGKMYIQGLFGDRALFGRDGTNYGPPITEPPPVGLAAQSPEDLATTRTALEAELKARKEKAAAAPDEQ